MPCIPTCSCTSFYMQMATAHGWLRHTLWHVDPRPNTWQIHGLHRQQPHAGISHIATFKAANASDAYGALVCALVWFVLWYVLWYAHFVLGGFLRSLHLGLLEFLGDYSACSYVKLGTLGLGGRGAGRRGCQHKLSSNQSTLQRCMCCWISGCHRPAWLQPSCHKHAQLPPIRQPHDVIPQHLEPTCRSEAARQLQVAAASTGLRMGGTATGSRSCRLCYDRLSYDIRFCYRLCQRLSWHPAGAPWA